MSSPVAHSHVPRVTFYGSRRVNYVTVGSHGWFCNMKRDATLRYIMEKYNDADKAARVLGCSPNQCLSRWRYIQA